MTTMKITLQTESERRAIRAFKRNKRSIGTAYNDPQATAYLTMMWTVRDARQSR